MRGKNKYILRDVKGCRVESPMSRYLEVILGPPSIFPVTLISPIRPRVSRHRDMVDIKILRNARRIF